MAAATIAIPDLAYRQAGFSLSPRVDQVGIEERAARFTKRSIKKETKVNGLLLTLNMIDLTTLEGKDSEGKVKQMCYKAKHLLILIRACQQLQRFVFIHLWLKQQRKQWKVQE